MAVYNGTHPKDAWPGVDAHFGHTLSPHTMEYKQLFTERKSDKLYEERVQRVGTPMAAIKGEGAAIDVQDSAQGYTSRITNIVYAQMGLISREAVEDNQYFEVATESAEFIARAIREALENVGANIFNRATNGSYLGGDGVALASASHPESSGNQSNLLSPAADFSEVALEDMLIQIGQALNPAGHKASIKGLKLVGPIQLQFDFCRVLKSLLQSNSANNDTNAVREMGLLGGGKYFNSHYFTDADAWGILTDAPHGLTCYNRREVEFAKDNDFTTENLLVKGSVRKGYGWGEWRAVYWSAGA